MRCRISAAKRDASYGARRLIGINQAGVSLPIAVAAVPVDSLDFAADGAPVVELKFGSARGGEDVFKKRARADIRIRAAMRRCFRQFDGDRPGTGGQTDLCAGKVRTPVEVRRGKLLKIIQSLLLGCGFRGLGVYGESTEKGEG